MPSIRTVASVKSVLGAATIVRNVASQRRSLPGRASVRAADEGMNSLSNMVSMLAAAHFSTSGAGFGRIALVYTIYILGLNALRALSSEIAMVRFSNSKESRRRTLESELLSFSIAVGAIGGLLIIALGTLFAPHSAPGWLILGISAPLLLLQDAARWVWLLRDASKHAFLLDGVWLTVVVGGLSLAAMTGSLGGYEAAWPVLAIWALGGVTSSLLAAFSLRGLRYRMKLARSWWGRYRRMGGSYLVEFVAGRGSVELIFLLSALLLGLSELGYLRLVNTLFGPLMIVTFGLQSMGVQAVSAVVDASQRWRIIRQVSGWCALAALAYGICLLLVPESLLNRLLGVAAAGAVALIPINMVRRILVGLITGLWAGMRATEDLATARRLRLITGGMTVIAGLLGMISGTAFGVMVSLTLASLVTTLLYFSTTRERILAKHVGPADSL